MILENNSLLNETGNGNTSQIFRDCKFSLDVYNIIRMCIYLIGIIGKAIVIFVIIRSKTMRSPTYLCIGSLAAADFIFLLKSAIYVVCIIGYLDIENYRRVKKCIPDFLYYYNIDIMWIFGNAAYISSAFHVVVLSTIRYITLVYPLKSRYILTKCRVSIMITLAWLFSFPFSICHNIIGGDIFNTIEWIVSYTIPVVLIVFLHLGKLFVIRRTSLSITRADVVKMNILVITVISVFTILPLPWNLLKLVFFFYQPEAVTYDHWQICGLLLVSNNSLNPLLYAFLSSLFRKRLETIVRPIGLKFNCLKPNKSRQGSVSNNMGTSNSVFSVQTPV